MSSDGKAVQLTPGELSIFLSANVQAGNPVLVAGEPGIGKSEIWAQVVARLGWDFKLFHPSVSDPTDYKGVAWPDTAKGRADILPLADLGELLDAKRPTLALFDDLRQAPRSVQAPIMQLIRARCIGSLKVPDCVVFGGATNGRAHRAGGDDLIEPLKSRFTSIVELVTNLEDFLLEWYRRNGDPRIAGFLRLRPDLLCKFEPSSDTGNSPLPRTWESAGKILALGLPAGVERAGLCGAVGIGAGVELMAFLKVAEEQVDPDEIIRHPETVPIPETPSALYATCAAVAYRATAGNFDKIVTYAQRLRTGDDGKGKKQGVFGVLLILDSYRRHEEVGATEAFTKVVHSDLGKLIRGQLGVTGV